MGGEFDGAVYDKLKEALEARRAIYLGLVFGDMSFTRATEAVGVSKRTGKAWRNGRGSSSGRDELPRPSTGIVGTWKNRRR